MAAKPERCALCHRLKKRSNVANARYWLLLHRIADKVRPEGKQYSPESFHAFFKQRFIGMDDVTLPNGKVIPMLKSSADLDKDEFNIYMANVESWAMEREIYLDEMAES